VKHLRDFIPLVKGQMQFHETRSKTPEYTPARQEFHAGTATQFRELLEAIEKMPVAVEASSNPLTLTQDDLVGLPKELLEQLNISDADRADAIIVELINAAGGTLLLDKILIGLYKATGQVHQRNQVISRVYRLGKKGMVFSVPRKKGLYTTTRPEISERRPRRG
jgi:hypothetical protein